MIEITNEFVPVGSLSWINSKNAYITVLGSLVRYPNGGEEWLPYGSHVIVIGHDAALISQRPIAYIIDPRGRMCWTFSSHLTPFRT